MVYHGLADWHSLREGGEIQQELAWGWLHRKLGAWSRGLGSALIGAVCTLISRYRLAFSVSAGLWDCKLPQLSHGSPALISPKPLMQAMQATPVSHSHNHVLMMQKPRKCQAHRAAISEVTCDLPGPARNSGRQGLHWSLRAGTANWLAK